MTEPPRTVQSYIDQTPAWPDGTPTDFVPMTAMQWRIWLLASAGKFFEGLVVFLFGVGLALGCDYPTAHLVISESIASKDRGKLVLSAFAFQAIGALVGTVVGFLILSSLPEITAWRWMYATAIVPAVVVVLGRLRISDSGHWLMSQGRKAEAEAEVARLLEREPPYPKVVRLADLA